MPRLAHVLDGRIHRVTEVPPDYALSPDGTEMWEADALTNGFVEDIRGLDKLRALMLSRYEALPADVRAAFATLHVVVTSVMDRGDYEVATMLVEGAQVPEQYKLLRDGMARTIRFIKKHHSVASQS